MIIVTKLNDDPIVINAEMIKSLESHPDTIMTLLSGEKIIVKESVEVIIERVVAYKKVILGIV